MSEEDRPPPTDDYATAALIRHWHERKIPRAHMVYATDSPIFTEPGFAGAVITSRPPPPSDPEELLPTLETQTLIIPAPSIVIVSTWQSLVSRIAKLQHCKGEPKARRASLERIRGPDGGDSGNGGMVHHAYGLYQRWWC